jgi:hypothetical protein
MPPSGGFSRLTAQWDVCRHKKYQKNPALSIRHRAIEQYEGKPRIRFADTTAGNNVRI